MRIIGLAVLGLLLVSCADAATQCQWARGDLEKAEKKIDEAQQQLDTGVMSMGDIMRAHAVLKPLVEAKVQAQSKVSEKCK